MPTVSTRGANCTQAFGSLIEIKPLPPPPNIGDYLHGGFYFGRIKVGNVVYDLFVSDKAFGQFTGAWSDINGTAPAPNSVNDGYANTYGDTSVSHPTSDWARNLDIGGYHDWYIPSRDEMELLYRNLKPTTDDNYLGSQAQFPGEPVLPAGANPSSVPPWFGYTVFGPLQTSVLIFRDGAQQALQTNTDAYAIGHSTAYFPAQQGYTVITTGQATSGSNRFEFAHRAIRRVKVGSGLIPGDAYGGGYFVGVIKADNKYFNLIVSPKAEGSTARQYFSNGVPLPADVADSVNDGWANTNKNNKEHYPACQWARSLSINGFTDWYVPSRDELELFYRNLKTSTFHNDTAMRPIDPPDTVSVIMGTNPNSVPYGPGYTATNPAQTDVSAFREGGSEAEETGSSLWSSSTLSATPADAIYQRCQSNQNGQQSNPTVNAFQAVRAFRRELIS